MQLNVEYILFLSGGTEIELNNTHNNLIACSMKSVSLVGRKM